MNKSIFLLCIILIPLFSFSQKMKFNEKKKIYINNNANPKYQVKFLDPEIDTIMKVEEVVYSSIGDTLNYKRTKKLNWKIARTLNKDSIMKNGILLPKIIQNADYLLADVKPEDNRLLIYVWPFNKNPSRTWILGKKVDTTGLKNANELFQKMQFSLELGERINLSLRSSAMHVGVLTIPIKVYLGAPDSISAIQAGVTAGLYLGKRWGKTKYVKLPNEKDYNTYETSSSLNVL